ncbi:hypothetical protein R1flu_006497 [Riccia fluitans]|uniref:Uncharacterized protein n=1 Tax=Riccia fluitans TaxID=41844 RepID=A0ABD1YWX1_9MARC
MKTKKDGERVQNYWCSYGPEDERTPTITNWAGLLLSAKNNGKGGRGVGNRPARLIVSVGLSCRRGCRCHFSTKTCPKKLEAIEICWKEMRHVDKNGLICHGLFNKDAANSNAELAPHMSAEARDFGERLM